MNEVHALDPSRLKCLSHLPYRVCARVCVCMCVCVQAGAATFSVDSKASDGSFLGHVLTELKAAFP